MTGNVTLSTKQQRAVVMLLAHPTIEGAAEAAGIATKTLYRWMRQPAFLAALGQAESEAIGHAARSLCALSEKAVKTLGAVLDDAKATASAKTRAAAVVIDSLLKLRELRDIETRLQALEEQIHASDFPN